MASAAPRFNCLQERGHLVHFVLLKIDDNYERALYRIQIDALLEGLKVLDVPATKVLLSAGPFAVEAPSHVVFNYRDKDAFAAAGRLKRTHGCKVLCFASDVYDLSHFVALAEAVDLFLAPTPLHCDLIQSAVTTPVAYVPESVDPIALPGRGSVAETAAGDRLLWFGFPESFPISTRFLLPRAFVASSFDPGRFCILTTRGAQLAPGIEHRPFSAAGFHGLTGDCSHSLLSHFCYDQKLNTYIKSPNKMITSIVRGLVPLASATPAYLDLARRFGLEALTYTNPGGLAALLSSLDRARDAARFRLNDVRTELLRMYSPENVARKVLELVS